MKIYLASKYSRHSLNNNIKKAIESTDKRFKVLLPESMKLEEATEEQRRIVKEKCCGMIRESDIVLAVEPFGRDVSFEIGYAQALKDCGKNIEIVRVGKAPKIGAMVDPSISYNWESAVSGEEIGKEFSELLKYLYGIKR